MAPVPWNGADTIYTKFIKPFVLRHQQKIDQTLDKVGEQVDKYAKEGKQKHCVILFILHRNVCITIKPDHAFLSRKIQFIFLKFDFKFVLNLA